MLEIVSPDRVQFSAKAFPFYLLLRLIFAQVVCIYDQCIYCSNVDHAIKHCHCPSASCSLYCTLHTFDPACLMHLLFRYVIQWFQAFLNRRRLLNHDGVMQRGHWLVLLWDMWHNCKIPGKSKNGRVFITLPGRLELLLNFSCFASLSQQV